MSKQVRLVWLTIGLVCAMLSGTATKAQKVSNLADGSYDFSQHRKYAWRENRLVTRQNPDTNKVMDLKIVKNVNAQLAEKGFVEVQENPDFYVYYDAGGNQNMGVGGADALNSNSGAPNDPAPTYGLGQGPMLTPSTWLIVKGQIAFHIVDAKTKQQLWASTYQKTFRDPDKAMREMDKELSQLVTKCFKSFPPKAKK